MRSERLAAAARIDSLLSSDVMRLTADQVAAHQLLCELRTRILTQRLPYQLGVEASALESLHSVFEHARAAMKGNPGCADFARRTTTMLNRDLRPVTAKWHRALVEGRLASRDGADEFRADLDRVRDKIRRFSLELQDLAYGKSQDDVDTPAVLSASELAECLAPLPFGIPHGDAGEASDGQDIARHINESEALAVLARRENQNRELKRINGVGLALSGGGIRSATFCLGVVQVLASRGMVEHIDFLSTVSGGGYTGSFLSTVLPGGEPDKLVGNPYGPDPKPIAQLRANARYLTSAGLWQAWQRASATVAGMLLNWTAPALIIVLAAITAALPTNAQDYLPAALTSSTVVSLFAMLLYGLLMRAGEKPSLWGGGLLAAASGTTVFIGVMTLLAAGHDAMSASAALADTLPGFSWSVGLVAVLSATGPAVLRFLPVLRSPLARKVALRVLLTLAALVLPLLGLVLFNALWTFGERQLCESACLGIQGCTGIHILAAAAVVLALVAGFIVDINLTSPHRLYRDALAKTFVTPPDIKLSKLSTETCPYLLVNATVNLPTSVDPRLRDRKSDFFVFSKHWCGSVVTGYHDTDQWRADGNPLELRTAMAVSGAAASSHMGLLSLPTLTALITFLNVRLGFWIKNPNHRHGGRSPGFSWLMREMLGLGMSERSGWLNLSDGGHIENTGCYELFRRRCKFVIAVDGEADPSMAFGGLMTLIRHLQINLGVRIEPALDGLRKDPKTGYSQSHALLWRVHYPRTAEDESPPIGLLLYVKLSLSGNEPELLRRYRAVHPEFPHQSTLDQFFDEEQFEVYRQLGVHAADGLFSRALLNDKESPRTITEWFGSLAENLLEPSRVSSERSVV